MSTRANVVIQSKKSGEKLFFYRHSDGYPKNTMPPLELFLSWVKDGRIRNNVMQASGWLVLIGAMEYNTIPKYKKTRSKLSYMPNDISKIEAPNRLINSWKVGAFEPTTEIHGDIQYLYVIDLDEQTITTYSSFGKGSRGAKAINYLMAK